nr:unnamed protein product [Callosobruchus analis]
MCRWQPHSSGRVAAAATVASACSDSAGSGGGGIDPAWHVKCLDTANSDCDRRDGVSGGRGVVFPRHGRSCDESLRVRCSPKGKMQPPPRKVIYKIYMRGV